MGNPCVSLEKMMRIILKPAGFVLLVLSFLTITTLLLWNRKVTITQKKAEIATTQPDKAIAYKDKVVSLQLKANNKYVCAENDKDNALIPNRSKAAEWEEFTVRTLDKNKVSLLAYSNHKFVTVIADGTLFARGTTAGVAGSFEWIDLGNNNIALRSSINGKIVEAPSPNTGGYLVARSETISPAAMFHLTIYKYPGGSEDDSDKIPNP